jgi:flagellin FlaB
MRKDEQAQVGIGTLIIFIAMVLVAAVAASVLIQTSGVLQQKAQATGKETVQEVASNLAVTQIVGSRSSATSNDLEYLNITLKVMAGAEAIDLRQVKITLQNETTRIENIGYTSTNADIANMTSTDFYVVELRDDDSSLDASTNTTTVINSGDLAYLVLKPRTSMDFQTREPLRIEINPEFGGIVVNDLNTPASYGVQMNVVLYP